MKDLETVQDKLEKKEEELRSERNMVMEKKAYKCNLIVNEFGVVILRAKQEEPPWTPCYINYLTHYARFSLDPYFVKLVNFSKYRNNPLIAKMIFSQWHKDSKVKLRVLPNTRIFPPSRLCRWLKNHLCHVFIWPDTFGNYYVRHVATENFNCGQGKVDLDSKIFLSFAIKLNILCDYMSHKRFVATLIFFFPSTLKNVLKWRNCEKELKHFKKN